jgi:hypothetical protein
MISVREPAGAEIAARAGRGTTDVSAYAREIVRPEQPLDLVVVRQALAGTVDAPPRDRRRVG